MPLTFGHQCHNAQVPTCQLCGCQGHEALKCWYRWNFSYLAQEELPQALATLTVNEEADANIYMDTGASAHITNNLGTLTNLIPYDGYDKVIVGDGSKLHISHIGDCLDYKNIRLNNVLMAPDIKKNLISVSQLAKDNSCICEFTDSDFVIKDLETGKVLATGSKKGDLMLLIKMQS